MAHLTNGKKFLHQINHIISICTFVESPAHPDIASVVVFAPAIFRIFFAIMLQYSVPFDTGLYTNADTKFL